MDKRRKEANDKGSVSEVNGDSSNQKGKDKVDEPSRDSVSHRLQASGQLMLNALSSVSGSSDLSATAPGASKSNDMRQSEDLTNMPYFRENVQGMHQRSSDNAISGSSFRENQSYGAEDQAFDAFMEQKEPVLSPSGCDGPSLLGDVAHTEEKDGAVVRDLLSGVDDMGGLPAEMDGSDVLTPADFNKLRRALFENEHGQTWRILLDFEPGWLRSNKLSEGMQSCLGTNDFAEGRDMWLNGWHEVLSSYNEEVWGDLSSIIVDARSQLKEVKEGNNAVPRGGGLERLRIILAHVRGYIT